MKPGICGLVEYDNYIVSLPRHCSELRHFCQISRSQTGTDCSQLVLQISVLFYRDMIWYVTTIPCSISCSGTSSSSIFFSTMLWSCLVMSSPAATLSVWRMLSLLKIKTSTVNLKPEGAELTTTSISDNPQPRPGWIGRATAISDTEYHQSVQ